MYNKAFKFAGDIAAWTAKNGRFLKSIGDFVGYSHDGCGFFYICQNPRDVQPKEWALMQMQTLVNSIGEGNGNALQYSCLENPMDGGAW